MASATEAAAPNRPAKLFGRSVSPSMAKIEIMGDFVIGRLLLALGWGDDSADAVGISAA
ncbi:MAG: hypothetical protein ACLP0Q_05865 [Rhodoblastus sp.]